MKKVALIILLTVSSLAIGSSASYYLHDDISKLFTEEEFSIDKQFDDLIYANLDPDPEEEIVLYYAVPAFSSNQNILLEKVIEVYDNQDGNWVQAFQLREGFEKTDDGKGKNRVENPIEDFSIVDVNNDGLEELLVMQSYESEAAIELNQKTQFTLTNSDYTLIGYQDGSIDHLNILTGSQNIPIGAYAYRTSLNVKDGKLVEYWTGRCEEIEVCYTFQYEIYTDPSTDAWVIDHTNLKQEEGWTEYKELFPDAIWSDTPYHWTEYTQ